MEEELVIRQLPLHHSIDIELNSIFVEELYKVVAKVVKAEDVSLEEYRASNIEREEKPIQYLPVDDIPDYAVFKPFTRESGFEETSLETFKAPVFQALRVRNGLGKMFVAFRKFSRRQIVGSSW